MRGKPRSYGLLLAAALLAGCTAPASLGPTSSGPMDDAQDGALPLPALDLAGQGCREAGGHSVHPKGFNPLPKPWMPADIIEDVGPQLWWSEMPDPDHPEAPREGNTIGNYHATVICDTWTFHGEDIGPMVLGFVAMRIEAPPFADDTPVRQYLITVLAASDDRVVEAFHAAGFHAVPTTGLVDEADGVVHTLLDTDGHGVYESYFLPKPMGPMPDGVMRLWWQHENANGTFSPIALDMASGPGGAHVAAEGNGYFSHLQTHDHDPLPGAAGHIAALMYTGFDRTFGWGPRPDVVLEEAYVHL